MVDPRPDLAGALVPLVVGEKVLAVRVYYVCTNDDGRTADVGAMSLAAPGVDIGCLAALIREDQALASLPNAEGYSISFLPEKATQQ